MVSSREILKMLEAEGWRVRRQGGSHVQLKHPSRSGTVTVPHPRRDMPLGTLRSIEAQSDMTLTRK